jgi:hypothetical protein
VRLTASSTPPPPGDFLLCAPDADILRACDIYISTATMQKRWPPDLYWRDSLSESVTQRLAPCITILHNLITYGRILILSSFKSSQRSRLTPSLPTLFPASAAGLRPSLKDTYRRMTPAGKQKTTTSWGPLCSTYA